MKIYPLALLLVPLMFSCNKGKSTASQSSDIAVSVIWSCDDWYGGNYGFSVGSSGGAVVYDNAAAGMHYTGTVTNAIPYTSYTLNFSGNIWDCKCTSLTEVYCTSPSPFNVPVFMKNCHG